MKGFIFAVFFMLGLTLFIGEGLAHQVEDTNKPMSKEKKQRIIKKIATLKMWELTKVFDLDEKRASKLFPVINKYDKRRFVIRVNMRNDMRKLRESVDTASEGELGKIFIRVKNNHLKLQEIDDEELIKLKNMLTVREMARFIIFKHDFNREIKGRIFRIREKRARKLMYKDMRPPAESPGQDR